jgi:hypothetical protein
MRQQRADNRPQREADAERRAKETEGFRALFRRRDVGQISLRRRDVAAVNAVDSAAEKQSGIECAKAKITYPIAVPKME